MLKTVLDYIEATNPPEVRQLLLSAHIFLQETLPPYATASIKWKIPFYRLNRNFCYLNRHRDHITIGFSYGWRLAEIPGVLLGENEKLRQIRYIEIRSREDLYSATTQQILQEAIILDETMAKSRKNRYRKESR